MPQANPSAPYHPSKFPGAPVDPVSGLAIGPTVWEGKRLHHMGKHAPMDRVRCACGRSEDACMMVDLTALAVERRPAHGADFACTGCVEHARQQGRATTGELAQAHGAPAHIVALHGSHDAVVAERLAALALRVKLGT